MTDTSVSISPSIGSPLPADRSAIQKRAAVGRTKPLRVTGKLKEACDYLAYEGLPFNEAAQKANLSVHAMRLAMQRPHVIAYLKAQRDVLRTSMSGRNILVLAEVRDQTTNQMARVQAVKALEQISDEPTAAPGRAAIGGVVIQIIQQSGSPQPVTINATEHGPGDE